MDAVEIDPRILQIGQQLHPDKPYADPRVTTIVDDPVYLTGPYIVSPHFKREPDGSKWDPTPCSSTW